MKQLLWGGISVNVVLFYFLSQSCGWHFNQHDGWIMLKEQPSSSALFLPWRRLCDITSCWFSTCLRLLINYKPEGDTTSVFSTTFFCNCSKHKVNLGNWPLFITANLARFSSMTKPTSYWNTPTFCTEKALLSGKMSIISTYFKDAPCLTFVQVNKLT